MREDKGIAVRGVLRLGQGAHPSAQDTVAVEEPLEIRIEGDPVALTMRTPGDDERLALGFLHGEGILQSIADVGTARHCGATDQDGYGNVLDVLPAPGVRLDLERVLSTRRGTLTTSACGVCGRASVEDLMLLCRPVPVSFLIKHSVVVQAPSLLAQRQTNFRRTGGMHAAAALTCEGELLAAFEDVGRHNAVDKVVGELLFRGLSKDAPCPAAVLVVSGRASFEIVQKAAMAKIGVVASVSAASTLAIDLATRCNVTLASFVRDGGFNVYSHPQRLIP